jgi:1-deoxy-D-xylulose-5-phosphate synthase
MLEEIGIHAAVVNARFVKPLDGKLLPDLGQKTGRILTVEENVLDGGFGSAVLELYRSKGLHSLEVRCLGIPDVFVEHGTQSQLRRRYGIDSHGIYLAAMDWIGKEKKRGKRAILMDSARISR